MMPSCLHSSDVMFGVRTIPASTQAAVRGQGLRRRRPSRAGFTLLEVMCAMGILVVGMTMVLSLFTFGAAMSRSAKLRASASTAVEAVMADLESNFFPLADDGTVGEPQPIVDRPVPSAPGVVYSAKARPNPDDPDEYRVDVDLRWSTSGVQRTRSFTTILLRQVPFGERLRRRFIEPGS